METRSSRKSRHFLNLITERNGREVLPLSGGGGEACGAHLRQLLCVYLYHAGQRPGPGRVGGEKQVCVCDCVRV